MVFVFLLVLSCTVWLGFGMEYKPQQAHFEEVLRNHSKVATVDVTIKTQEHFSQFMF